MNKIMKYMMKYDENRSCSLSQGVFLDACGRRVGGFYQLDAAQKFLANGGTRCPVTEEPIQSVKEVPSILEAGDPPRALEHLEKQH